MSTPTARRVHSTAFATASCELLFARRHPHTRRRLFYRVGHLLAIVDDPIAPAQEAVDPRVRDARAHPAVADGIDDSLGREAVGLDDGVGPAHLERVVGVAAADQRQVALAG